MSAERAISNKPEFKDGRQTNLAVALRGLPFLDDRVYTQTVISI